ncbi:ralyl: RNA-binding Raly-like, partial [Crotalus adamanteus]
RAEELHSIKGELSQIKAQRASLDRAGTKDSKRKLFDSVDASYPAAEPIRMKDSAEQEGHTPQQDVDSAEESTDTEEAAAFRNYKIGSYSSRFGDLAQMPKEATVGLNQSRLTSNLFKSREAAIGRAQELPYEYFVPLQTPMSLPCHPCWFSCSIAAAPELVESFLCQLKGGPCVLL